MSSVYTRPDMILKDSGGSTVLTCEYEFQAFEFLETAAAGSYTLERPLGSVNTTGTIEVAPDPPTALTATAISQSSISLSWEDGSSNETGFEVERSLDGSTGWVQIGDTGFNSTVYVDTALTANTAYYYRVRSINGAGQSVTTLVATATTLEATSNPPDAPTVLIVTTLSSTRLALNWTDNSNDETGFSVERSADGTTGWTEIITLGPSAASYNDQNLTLSTLYYYRVRAYNAYGYSGYSNIDSATTAATDDLLATVLSNYSLPPQDAEGYSILTPSADSRLIYVDATGGNDATAVNYTTATLPSGTWQEPTGISAYQDPEVAVLQMRQDYPDYLLLKCGERFTTSNYMRIYSGRSATERAIVTSYGTGDRPWLTSTTASEIIRIWNFGNYIGVLGLKIYPTHRDPDHVDFAGWGSTGSMRAIYTYGSDTHPTKTGLLYENNDIRFCTGGVSFSTDRQVGPMGVDVIIRRNKIQHNYSETDHCQGIFGARYEMLMEDNLLHHNGWYKQSFAGTKAEGQATIFNHNVYIGNVSNYLLRNNISSKPSSLGFKFVANPKSPTNSVEVSNTIIDGNLIIDAEVGLSVGGNSDYENGPRWDNMQITNNVLTKIGESQQTGRTLAWGIEVDDWQSGVVSGNLLHDFGSDTVNNVLPIFVKGYVTNVTVDSNVCWNLGKTTGTGSAAAGIRINDAGDTIGSMAGVIVSNNYFECPDKEMWVVENEDGVSGVAFTDNNYFSARATSEWFGNLESSYSYADWQALSTTTDTGGTLTATTWVDDTRTVETYMTSLGQTATYDAFIVKALAMMGKGTWDANYTASALNNYMRAGFTPV